MRIASLGSGSKGNATLVDTGETLLIDCGLTRREAEERLVARGVSAERLMPFWSRTSMVITAEASLRSQATTKSPFS